MNIDEQRRQTWIIHDEYLHGYRALGLEHDICFESDRMIMHLYLTLAWTGTSTRLYASTWEWSAQPGRRVTRAREIPFLIWSTWGVITHWTCHRKYAHLSWNCLTNEILISYTMYPHKLRKNCFEIFTYVTIILVVILPDLYVDLSLFTCLK